MSRLTGRTEGRFVAAITGSARIRTHRTQMRSSLPKLVRSSRFSSDTVYCGRHSGGQGSVRNECCGRHGHQGSTAGGVCV
ncbi:MAG TPA: hypothetical protein ENO20_03520, partial [Bacteroides sp.]|nr:hypothetical protein [Bacteroides sp.]